MNWFRDFNNCLPAWPDNYVSFDIETTGFSPTQDLVLEFGYCFVEDRKVANKGSILLDWSHADGEVPQGVLRDKLERTRASMASKGLNYPFTVEMLAKEGVHPIDGVQEIAELLDGCIKDELHILTHNGYRFDVPMLQGTFADYIDSKLILKPNLMFDTGGMEKASQTGQLPKPTDTLESFFCHLSSGRGVKWALWGHSLEKYQLCASHELDRNKSHRGGYDAWVTHLLFELYRQLSEFEGSIEQFLQTVDV